MNFPGAPQNSVACVQVEAVDPDRRKLFRRYTAPTCCAADGTIDGAKIIGTLSEANVPASKIQGDVTASIDGTLIDSVGTLLKLMGMVRRSGIPDEHLQALRQGLTSRSGEEVSEI